MTVEETQAALDEVTVRLLDLASEAGPQVFQALFSASIANVVGNLPEDYWQEFLKIRPCGRPGCTCHLDVVPHAMELFKWLRQDHGDNTEITMGAG